jgi:hypothetical protein
MTRHNLEEESNVGTRLLARVPEVMRRLPPSPFATKAFLSSALSSRLVAFCASRTTNHNFCHIVNVNIRARYIDHDSHYPSSSILVLGAWHNSGATDWREECITVDYLFTSPLSQILGVHLRRLGVHRLSLHESPSEQQSKPAGEYPENEEPYSCSS